MRARVEAGTDVAMIGAWDAGHEAAGDAELFTIHTGADGGGPVDVFVDEPIPAGELARLRPIEGQRRLSLPSGRLRIAGAEYYRASNGEARPTEVAIPPGDYAVSAFVPRDEEEEPPSEAELRRRVGADELRRYDRINLGIVIGGFVVPVLLLAMLAMRIGFLWALVPAIAFFLAWFPAAQWLMNRFPDYRRLREVATDFRLRRATASIVLTLRRLGPGETLAGGSVSLPRE